MCVLVPLFDKVLGMLAYVRVAPRLLKARQPLAPA